jgi:hypothetical protein
MARFQRVMPAESPTAALKIHSKTYEHDCAVVGLSQKV